MEELQPLSQVLGHSPLQCTSWESKGDFRTELGKREAVEYAQWLQNALDAKDTKLARSLCFLDLTMANAKSSDFQGVLISSGPSQTNTYRDTVERLNGYNSETGIWEPTCQSIGSHTVFQAGLPVYLSSDKMEVFPRTGPALEDCQIRGFQVVGDQYLLWLNDEEEHQISRHSPEQDMWYADWLGKEAFGHPTEARRYRERVLVASEHDVMDSWKVWMEFLSDRCRDLTTLNGDALIAVLGMPLCVWTQGRHPVPIAQIFIGTGGENALDNARRILRVVALHALRATTAGRAEYLGGVRSRYAAAHRLPGTIDAVIAVMNSEMKELPPIAYELKATSTLQKGGVPVWRIYEEMCRSRDWMLTRDVIESIWKDIALPLAEYRVLTDENRDYQKYYDNAGKPDINVTGTLHFTEKELECSALISLCVPLMAEAYQHALIWSIETRATERPVVEIAITDEQISIDNVTAASEHLSGFGTQFTNQIEEIELIQSRAGYWRVTFPPLDQVEKSGRWTVTSCRDRARPQRLRSEREA